MTAGPRRLAGSGARMAVLNAGIGGNRVLSDGNGPKRARPVRSRRESAQPGV